MRFSNLLLSSAVVLGTVGLVQGNTFAQTMSDTSSSSSMKTTMTKDMSSMPETMSTKPAAALIDVNNQILTDSKVYLKQVDAPAIGYVVIHENDGGKPGDVLGYVPIESGINKDIYVPISRLPKDGTALAVVHSGNTTRSAYINTLGRFDPVAYPIARGGNKSAIASFMIMPATAMAPDASMSSTSTYKRSETMTTPMSPNGSMMPTTPPPTGTTNP